MHRRRWAATVAGVVALGGLTALPATVATADSQPFTNDGTFTVPANICSVTVAAAGGAGASTSSSAGGAGGAVSAEFPVVPGEDVTVTIGRGGAVGVGGGGDGFAPGGDPVDSDPGGGGGATAVRRGSTPLLIAGGGGGAGGDSAGAGGAGGAGGGSALGIGGTGFRGADGDGPVADSTGGDGGTATGGAGTGGGSTGTMGGSGTVGGGGGTGGDLLGGGGGGGFGGGGGGGGSGGSGGGGGGGGGSSTAFASQGATGITFGTGPATGDGNVTFLWDPTADACSSATVATPCGNVTITSFQGTVGAVSMSPVPATPPPPAGLAFPCGLIGFSVTGLSSGASATITVALPIAPSAYWKLQNGQWSQVTNASITGTQVRFSQTDGGTGDADGAANGTIVDPGGPTVAAALVATPSFTG